MLTELCAEIRNYFVKEIHSGVFEINEGGIEPLSYLQEGQYFRVVGSVFNDGVWRNDTEGMAGMKAETFRGAVWAMAVPPAVIALDQEITQWIADNTDALNSPFMSESFGGYSYSKGSSAYGGNGNGGAYGWKDQFASKLSPYRRVSVL